MHTNFLAEILVRAFENKVVVSGNGFFQSLCRTADEGRQNLPLPVRTMLLTSAAVLLLMWEAEYRYLKSVARDLNSGAAGRILLIDLDEKPGSSEEFFAALETYCKKSSITLEYVKRDIPATVKLNGRLHTVTLTESYMYGGPGWSMEIQEIL